MTFNIRSVLDIDNNVELWGGKAYALSLLGKNGFLIPKTLVISSDIYKSYQNRTLDIQQFESEITDMIRRFFPDMNTNLIFRSSANVESSRQTMCCGIFESKRHCPGHSFYETIRSVWDSTSSFVAHRYYQLEGLSLENISMAVIVQEIVKEKATAVIQTYDVVNDLPRMVLEYSFNSNNSIVDGTLDAEVAYIVSLEDVPQFMCAELRKQLISDCRFAEQVFNSHLEIEAQIGENSIYYLQARALV